LEVGPGYKINFQEQTTLFMQYIPTKIRISNAIFEIAVEIVTVTFMNFSAISD